MEKVKRLRQEVGMKQSELAAELRQCQSNYSKMENGKLITNTILSLEEKAIKILKPLLIQKIIRMQSEVERLEYLLLQLN